MYLNQNNVDEYLKIDKNIQKNNLSGLSCRCDNSQLEGIKDWWNNFWGWFSGSKKQSGKNTIKYETISTPER